MNVIGDLERLFATSLYPMRVPVAIGLIAVFAAVVWVGRRRGWFAAARRRPGRTGALAAIVLATALPVGWYLASPLFIRTELIEPAPVGVLAQASPSPAGSETPSPSRGPAASVEPAPASTPDPTSEPTPFVPTSFAAGAFYGADDFHFAEGTATIIETAPDRYTLRFEDFSVRNGPDLYVYLSPDPDGYVDGVLELGTLKATDGAFGYELPAGTDPADFGSAIIWCKQFAVLFAVAPFAAV